MGQVRKDITKLDINRVTSLALDWSKEGMGFHLLQKHNRFYTYAKCQYVPYDGEAAAIAWEQKMLHIHHGLPKHDGSNRLSPH